MSRQGDDFHKLVECLERVLSGQPDVTIEAPKFFKDKITGDMREHDVVLTYKQQHRELVVAIECRDRSRKVGVAQIEEFQTKCRDTGVDKGVIVSSKGFAKTAIVKADHYNIDCFQLEEVQNLDWCLMQGIYSHERQIIDSHVTVVPHDKSLSESSLENFRLFQVLSTGGEEEITKENIGNFVTNAFNNLPPESTPPEKNLVHAEIGNPQDFYLLDKDGTKHTVEKVKFYLPYKTTTTQNKVKYFNYGNGKGTKAYSTVMAEIQMGPDLKGNLVMVNDQKNIAIHFVPHKK